MLNTVAQIYALAILTSLMTLLGDGLVEMKFPEFLGRARLDHRAVPSPIFRSRKLRLSLERFWNLKNLGTFRICTISVFRLRFGIETHPWGGGRCPSIKLLHFYRRVFWQCLTAFCGLSLPGGTGMFQRSRGWNL